MLTSALLGAKNFRFFEIYGVSAARTERFEPVYSLFPNKVVREVGQFFAIFCERL